MFMSPSFATYIWRTFYCRSNGPLTEMDLKGLLVQEKKIWCLLIATDNRAIMSRLRKERREYMLYKLRVQMIYCSAYLFFLIL